MKLRRLWQPGRLLFWQMVMFNVLSSVCSWAMRALPLNTLGLLLVGFVALLNVGFGLLAAWMLVRDEPPAPGAAPGTAQRGASSGDSASTASTSE
jgi:hypothetical protein